MVAARLKDNGLIELFDGRLRDECLNTHEFVSMNDLCARLEAWRHDYNHHRPHGSLSHLTPGECAKIRSGQLAEKRPASS